MLNFLLLQVFSSERIHRTSPTCYDWCMEEPQHNILSPSDPPPYRWENENAAALCLLICEHASQAMPQSLGDLGLEPRYFDMHIAYDIGARELTEYLSRELDLTAIFAVYSRLAIDLNRWPDHPDLCAKGDKKPIPGNASLSDDEREARIRELYDPFHDEIEQWIDSRLEDGEIPVIITIHSFTPRLPGKAPRSQEIAVVSNADRRVAEPFMENLSACGYAIGDNKPFNGMKGISATFNRHGTHRHLPNLMFEVRNDFLQDPEKFARVAKDIAETLKAVLSDPTLYSLRP